MAPAEQGMSFVECVSSVSMDVFRLQQPLAGPFQRILSYLPLPASREEQSLSEVKILSHGL